MIMGYFNPRWLGKSIGETGSEHTGLAVKEVNLSYYIRGTRLFAMYIYICIAMMVTSFKFLNSNPAYHHHW